ncbi:hypothetical protein Srufu_025930 [Streptomyces libani subsp. rufus]|nr:hypothetical protein Srufu_025930 [Streptomyces libani subsp. rufus]
MDALASHPRRLLGLPRGSGDRFVSSGLSGEAVAEVSVGEGVDALVFVRVPAGESVTVLLLGTDAVGEVGQGAGGVAGHGAGGGPADMGVAGLVTVIP